MMESASPGSSWQQGGESGTMAADLVVNCGGMWGRDWRRNRA
jgi:hypothetical protein